MPPKKTSATSAQKFILIVESPSKCVKIESYLGENYKCISSKGHIREIDGLSNINVKDRFQIEFTPIKEKKEHIDTLKKLVAKYPASNVLLATDDDREGEAIAWHICQVCGLDVLSTKRIVFHEITQPALLEAVANPGRINLSLVAAQQARQVLDMVVGFKISPLLWHHIGGNRKNALSAGRCQTPALRLVNDHHVAYKEAISRGSSQVHRITGTFTNKCLPFHLNQEFTSQTELAEFFELSKTADHRLSLGSSRPSTKSPPKPFNTSRLLQIASNQLRLSPKTTMNLCQTLYQSGLITYMRTDCQKYSRVFLNKCAKYIVEQFGDERYVGEFAPLELIDAAMPHEAIRVTNLSLQKFTNPDPQLVRLYGLIWRNTVESCMSVAKYSVVDAAIVAPLSAQYKYTIETPVFLGWRRLEITDATDSQSADSGILMYLDQIAKSGKPASWSLIESKVAMNSKAPTHYTEASLINALEELGIGRPSTFSTIVETIQDRGYVRKTNVPGIRQQCVEWKLRPDADALEKTESERVFGEEKDKLVIQPTGALVLDFLLKHFDDCFSYGYTKSMEDELDAVASQPAQDAMNDWHQICKRCLDDITERSKPLARQTKQTFCLADSSEYVLVFNSYGASLKRTLDDGKTEYAKVRTDAEIELDKARCGEYTFAELIWREDNGCLGTHQGHPVYLKKGKYGLYAEYGGDDKETVNLKSVQKCQQDITLGDVVELIRKKQSIVPESAAAAMFLPVCEEDDSTYSCLGKARAPLDKSVLRPLRTDLSIRKGRYGPYIFHKTSEMTNPEFYPLKPIAKRWQEMADLELIAWIENAYTISK